jgi:hypothetical protein
MDLDTVQAISSLWPLAFGILTLVIVLAKMHGAIKSLEDKMKTAFNLINKLRGD